MRRAAAMIAGFAFAGGAFAQDVPLWELGGGLAAISFPDYRGSDRQREYLLPVPMFIYRGEFLQADRERVRGLLYRSERAEIDISISGSIPTRSDDNPVRQGMPDLDPTLEIGPSLNLKLVQAPRHSLTLRLPVRAVIASDFKSVENAGVLANPSLNLDLKVGEGWKLGLVAGALFADRRLHQYFYGVDAAHARPGRPGYQAASGYSGAQLIASLTRRFDRLFIGGFVKADFLEGAKFVGSPLVERRNNLAAGIAVTYVFLQSQQRVAEPR